MSIFRKGRETPSTPEPSAPSSSPRPQAPSRRDPSPPSADKTYIARGTKVVGTVTGNAELVIDGEIEGEIHLDSTVIVGAEGRVQGTIHAVSVQVGGKVSGNVEGRERVEVLTAGGLEGDIVSPSVHIAEGAFYKGKVDMSSPPKRTGSAGASQSHGASKGNGAFKGNGASKDDKKNDAGASAGAKGPEAQGGKGSQPGKAGSKPGSGQRTSS